MQVIINGEIFNGSPENLEKVFEARGYHAQRNNLNPHDFWQYAEYLKFKKKDKK